MNHKRFCLAALVFSLCTLTSAGSEAQAYITVRVHDSAGRNMDGSVTLRAGQRTYSCRTTRGLCQIRNVPVGTYQATLSPVRETAPPPQTFTVRSNGPVSLSMRSVPRPTTQQVSSASASSASAATATRPRPVTGAVRPTAGQAAAIGALRPTGATQAARPAQICNSGRLLNSRGQPVAGSITAINGTARRTANAASNGTFRVCGLPHGRWTITATGGGESTRVTRTVSARTAINLRTAARSVRPATPARRPVTGTTGVRRIVR